MQANSELEGVTPRNHIFMQVCIRGVHSYNGETIGLELKELQRTPDVAAASAVVRQSPVAWIASSKPLRFVEETAPVRAH